MKHRNKFRPNGNLQGYYLVQQDDEVSLKQGGGISYEISCNRCVAVIPKRKLSDAQLFTLDTIHCAKTTQYQLRIMKAIMGSNANDPEQ